MSADAFDRRGHMNRHHKARSVAIEDDDLNAARGLVLGMLISALMWLVLFSV